MPLLMPELQKALLDPLPEVRATAARAMGSLLKGMGPAALGDLLPWLLTTLRSEGSSVERSGAAQVGVVCVGHKEAQRCMAVWTWLTVLALCGCVGAMPVPFPAELASLCV